MTATFGSYDAMLANPSEADEEDACQNCGGRMPDYAEKLCTRCSELVDVMENHRDVRELVSAVRKHLSTTNGWSSDLGRIADRFPEAAA